MRSYGTVAATFWTRGSGKLLRGDPEAQVVALYLMTGPASSMTGIYHLALPTLAHETGCPIEGACKALRRVCGVEIATYDEADELVWVPKLAFYQIGPSLAANDKRVRGVINAISQYAGHRFYWEFVREYGEKYNLGIRAPSKGHRRPSEGTCKPLRSQDQDQDQEIRIPSLPSLVDPTPVTGLLPTLDPLHRHTSSGTEQAAPPVTPGGTTLLTPEPPEAAQRQRGKAKPSCYRHIGADTEVPEENGIERARWYYAGLWREKYGAEYPDEPGADTAAVAKMLQHHKRAKIDQPWKDWLRDLFQAFLADGDKFVEGHQLRMIQMRLAKYEAKRGTIE